MTSEQCITTLEEEELVYFGRRLKIQITQSGTAHCLPNPMLVLYVNAIILL